MKKWISVLLLFPLLCCYFPSASADQWTDALNQAVPFGIAHSDAASALTVYQSINGRSAGRLSDYQLCAILSSKTSGGTRWYEVRYVSGGALKEGYIKGSGFYPLTLAGLIKITADAGAAETLRTLISTSKTNAFAVPSSTAAAQPKATETPRPAQKSTPKPSSSPSSGKKRYVLNTKTMKFHYPNCTEVSRITEENRKNTTTTRESLIDQGYIPCQKCAP